MLKTRRAKMFKRICHIGLIVLAVVVVSHSAGASDVIIGARAEPAVDPHFLYVDTNSAYNWHIFEPLVYSDENLQPKPGLAIRWEAIDDTTWEFKLREGVKFQDGSDFTAEDVVFSFKRIPNVPNNPASYVGTIRSIVDMEIVDPHTVRFKTDDVDPLLPNRIVAASIVSKKVAEGASTADFTSGKAAIGTGPFKFSEYVPGDRYVLERNENYWGEKPAWKRVTFKIISNDAARVAALLAGDVDAIDYVPPAEVAHLEKAKNISVFKRPTGRIMYLVFDHKRDNSPFVTTKDGKPLGKNPFKDVRVREAISLAIDRETLCKYTMEGLANPAGQFVPKGFLGYNPAIKVPEYDPDTAKKLLAEAGYPDGFGLTIHGPNDRYVNDAKVCQAIGQMLARIGLAMKVDTMPKAVYFSRLKLPNPELSFFLVGWGNITGEFTSLLIDVLHTYDKTKGMGSWNNGNYSNPELDRIAEQAASTPDPHKREKLLQQAMEMAVKDVALVPTHGQYTVLATRKGLTWTPRADEWTLAMGGKPTP
jgi:peptide/nickel transport system substrate-binding protein